MHRVSAVPAKKGVPRRLAVDEAAAAPLRDGHVTDGHSTEHGDERAGGHRMCLSDLCVVLIAESALGLWVRSAMWGTGSGPKFREEISEGERRTKLLDCGQRMADWLRARPAKRCGSWGSGAA